MADESRGFRRYRKILINRRIFKRESSRPRALDYQANLPAAMLADCARFGVDWTRWKHWFHPSLSISFIVFNSQKCRRVCRHRSVTLSVTSATLTLRPYPFPNRYIWSIRKPRRCHFKYIQIIIKGGVWCVCVCVREKNNFHESNSRLKKKKKNCQHERKDKCQELIQWMRRVVGT